MENLSPEIGHHVDGLLHLGALSIAIFMAYSGLDRMKKN